MKKFKTVYMRGGTSKGCIFLEDDLPKDKSTWDELFLKVMGSPDPKQIDGMGGCVSSNNKIVIVSKSKRDDAEIDYLVGQVVVGKNQIDYNSNCGNMTAAVGPFAIEEGLIEGEGESVDIRLYNKNTDKLIDVTVPLNKETGSFENYGSTKIAGVDGTSAEIKVSFLDPEGAKTGKLLPTGNPIDKFEIEGFGTIDVTILDVSNPLAIVRAEDIGLVGTELPTEVDSLEKTMDLLEKIRDMAAIKMGFAKNLKEARENSPAVPKIAFITEPKTYTDISGAEITEDQIDVCVRVLSVFKTHKASPLTSACAIATASSITGSIVNEICPNKTRIRLGHPSGIMELEVKMKSKKENSVEKVSVIRTARRIMDGYVYVK